MSRKQYNAPAKTHEGRMTPKREKKLRQQQIQEASELQGQQEQVPVTAEEVIPTEADKEQVKHLAIGAVVFIVVLLALMYWVFIS